MTILENPMKYNIFQTTQAFIHLILAFTAAFGIPDDYWWGFSKSFNVAQPIGIQILYLASFSYHLLMYFRDPSSGTVLRSRHLLVVSSVTILFIYKFTTTGIMIIFLNYILDLWDFVFYKLRGVDKSQIISVSIIKVHHILTVLLISLSWVYGLSSVGSTVMFINDVTDVPMFILRIIRRRKFSILSQFPLVCIIITTWLYYRVFYMGHVVYELYSNFLLNNPLTYQIPPITCAIFLNILLIFNTYWTYLVISKTIKFALL
jgi:hypothetical protein